MGRTVFAQPDRVVRHHMDDPDPHQRGEPDRRAAVVGENQKRAAIGNEAAMQGDAVHRRGHRMLADAVMDIVALEDIGPHRPLALGAGEIGMGEVGRAADRSGFARSRRSPVARPCRVAMVGPFGDEPVCELSMQRRIAGSFRFSAMERRESRRRLRTPCTARSSYAERPAPACADLAPLPEDVVRNLEWLMRPVQRVARVGDFLGAERRAVRLFACPAGSARRSRSWCGRRSATAGRLVRAPLDRRCDRLRGSWPSIRQVDQPAAWKRTSWSSEQDSDVDPSIEIWLSSNSTISRFSRRCPASDAPPG